MYLGDNKDKLPYAGLRAPAGSHASWDDLMDSYLGGNLVGWQKDWQVVQRYRLAPGTAPWPGPGKVLHCPAETKDNLPPNADPATYAYDFAQRTYAMPSYRNYSGDTFWEGQGSVTNWPPTADVATGVGMAFNLGTIGALSGTWSTSAQEQSEMAGKQWSLLTVQSIPSVRSSLVLNQAGTIAFTERANNPWSGYNGSWNAWIDGPWWSNGRNWHVAYWYPGQNTENFYPRFHNSLFNYAFVDGHVELLAPNATQSVLTTHRATPPAAWNQMWTIRAND